VLVSRAGSARQAVLPARARCAAAASRRMGSKQKGKELSSPQPPQRAAAGDAASTPQAKTPKGGKKRRAEEADATPSRGGAGGASGAGGAGGDANGSEPPAGPASAVDGFCARIGEHSAFFDHLVSLIPARFYLAPENEPETVRRRGSGAAAARHARVGAQPQTFACIVSAR
jgi:hypothetical protein